MGNERIALCIFFVAILMIKVTLQSLQDDIKLQMNDTKKGLLSRKRRYLIFPEGSSLQLVYCLTIPSIGVGSIFTVGSTAALAWELPHDPFSPFRRNSELLHRIDTKKPIEKPATSGGWTLQSTHNLPVTALKSYYNPFFINNPSDYSTINDYMPVAKNSYPEAGFNPISQSKIQTKKLTNYNTKPVTTYLHPVYHQIYRRTRRDLYGKIEKLFSALGKDGRNCLLKAICEVSQATMKRGTFMEEIFKAIFKVRHRQDQSDEEKDHYDQASDKQHNCTETYSTCEHSVWTTMFSYI